MQLQDRKIFLINFAFILTAVGLIYFTFRFMLAYLLPFLIGLIISYLMQRPAKILSSKFSIKKGICAAFLSVLMYLALIFLISIIIWTFLSRINTITGSISHFFVTLTNWIEKMSQAYDNFTRNFSGKMQTAANDFVEDALNKFITKITQYFSDMITSLVKSLPTFFVSSIVTVVATCYISKDYDRLYKFVKGLIKERTYNNIITIKNILFNCVFKFASGYFLLIIITFFEVLIGLIILGVEHYLIIAILIALIDILPVLGTGTVLMPWAGILFFNGDYASGLGLVVLYLVISVVRNIIEPKIISKKVGISPLFTLISMFLGLKLAGVAGMIVLPLITIVTINYYKQQIDMERLND